MPNEADKISIVGFGAIGATIAYSLLTRRLASEIVVFNRDLKKARARTFDMGHCTPGLDGARIRAGEIGDTADSDIVVMTAGVLPKEDGTRMDVLRDNVGLYRSIVPQVALRSPRAVLIVVTNPLDAMTFAAGRLSGFPSSRVIGSGTLLDGSRLKCFIAEEYDLDSSHIDLEVIGEHGDSMVPLWSRIRYSGEALERSLAQRGRAMDDAIRGKLLQRTKRAGWEIRLANEHSCYGISFSVVRIIETMLGWCGGAPTVSSLASGEYGIDGLCMSLPSILGRDGIKGNQRPVLSQEESNALHASARILKEQTDAVDQLLEAG